MRARVCEDWLVGRSVAGYRDGEKSNRWKNVNDPFMNISTDNMCNYTAANF